MSEIPAAAAARTERHYWQIIPGVALLVLACYFMMVQVAFRAVEARITAAVIALFTTGSARSAGDIVYFGIGTQNVEGIVITTLCSSVILAVPLLALAGILLLIPSMRLSRVLVGLVIALALALACNVARYVASAWALQSWGTDGFNLIHEYLGSFLVIIGFAAAFVILLKIATGRRHARS